MSTPSPYVLGYDMIRQISEGGNGELWLAEHLETRAVVGIAFLSVPLNRNNPVLADMRQQLNAHVDKPGTRLLVVNPPMDADFVGGAMAPSPVAVAPKGNSCAITTVIICVVGFVMLFIFALLASIAVPSFLRARQRSQATQIINDARIYEAAIDQWAITTNKRNIDPVTFDDVSDYITASPRLLNTRGNDILGREYDLSTVEAGVKVNRESYNELSDVTMPDFWGSYAP